MIDVKKQNNKYVESAEIFRVNQLNLVLNEVTKSVK